MSTFLNYRLLAAYVLVVLTLTGSWSCRSANQPEFLLRASLLVAEDHTWFRAFQHFGELLETRSDGRIKLQTYPSEQLAKEIEAIRAGFPFLVVSLIVLTLVALIPELSLFLPRLFL